MAASRGQTHAKRARELALQERRERKRAKKADAAAQRAAGGMPVADNGRTADAENRDAHAESAESIR